MKSLLKKDTHMIVKFRDERDWKQFHDPKNLAISLLLESSEVLELFQWSKNNKLSIEKMSEMKEELADVYSYLLLLCHELKIDISKELSLKMKKNAQKYPIEKAKGKATKYNKL